jgi:hypothetical protein
MKGRMPDFRLSAADHLNAARFWVEKAEEALGASLTMSAEYGNTYEVPPAGPDHASAAAKVAALHLMLADRTEDETA